MNNTCTLITTDSRLSGFKEKMWAPKTELSVGFLDGDPTVIQKVIITAEVWLKYANIYFDWRGMTDQTTIRISFKQEGSWSYLGKDCLDISRRNPTMNFGWLTTATDIEEYKRVVAHEFGHALGLVHEHNHPKNGIQWNKPVVYEAYKKSMGWSKEMVDAQIFQRYAASTMNYSVFDPDSIMCYHIPKEFTLDGFTNGWNTKLSKLDKQFISILYPGKAKDTYLPNVQS